MTTAQGGTTPGNPLGFAVETREQGFALGLGPRTLSLGVALREYQALIPEPEASGDPAAAAFRHRRSLATRLALQIERHGIQAWLDSAVGGRTLAGMRVDGSEFVAGARLRPQDGDQPWLLLRGRARLGTRQWVGIALDVTVDGRDLIVRPRSIWRFGDDVPAAAELWQALVDTLLGAPQLRGALGWVANDRDPAAVRMDAPLMALRPSWVGAGWKLPDLQRLMLTELELEPRSIRLAWATGGQPTQGRPAEHDAAAVDPVSATADEVRRLRGEGHVDVVVNAVDRLLSLVEHHAAAHLAAIRWAVELARTTDPQRHGALIRAWLRLHPNDIDAQRTLVAQLAATGDTEALARLAPVWERLAQSPRRRARLALTQAYLHLARQEFAEARLRVEPWLSGALATDLAKDMVDEFRQVLRTAVDRDCVDRVAQAEPHRVVLADESPAIDASGWCAAAARAALDFDAVAALKLLREGEGRVPSASADVTPLDDGLDHSGLDERRQAPTGWDRLGQWIARWRSICEEIAEPGQAATAMVQLATILADVFADPEAAGAQLERALARTPADAALRLTALERGFAGPDLAAAIEQCRELLATVPMGDLAFSALTRRATDAAIVLGDLPKARALLEQAHQRMGPDATLQARAVELGQAEAGDEGLASVLANIALRHRKTIRVTALRRRAQLLRSIPGRDAEAMNDLAAAHRESPDDETVAAELGERYGERKRFGHLAELYCARARRQIGPRRAEMLQRAARICAEHLGDSCRAEQLAQLALDELDVMEDTAELTAAITLDQLGYLAQQGRWVGLRAAVRRTLDTVRSASHPLGPVALQALQRGAELRLELGDEDQAALTHDRPSGEEAQTPDALETDGLTAALEDAAHQGAWARVRTLCAELLDRGESSAPMLAVAALCDLWTGGNHDLLERIPPLGPREAARFVVPWVGRLLGQARPDSSEDHRQDVDPVATAVGQPRGQAQPSGAPDRLEPLLAAATRLVGGPLTLRDLLTNTPVTADARAGVALSLAWLEAQRDGLTRGAAYLRQVHSFLVEAEPAPLAERAEIPLDWRQSLAPEPLMELVKETAWVEARGFGPAVDHISPSLRTIGAPLQEVLDPWRQELAPELALVGDPDGRDATPRLGRAGGRWHLTFCAATGGLHPRQLRFAAIRAAISVATGCAPLVADDCAALAVELRTVANAWLGGIYDLGPAGVARLEALRAAGLNPGECPAGRRRLLGQQVGWWTAFEPRLAQLRAHIDDQLRLWTVLASGDLHTALDCLGQEPTEGGGLDPEAVLATPTARTLLLGLGLGGRR